MLTTCHLDILVYLYTIRQRCIKISTEDNAETWVAEEECAYI